MGTTIQVTGKETIEEIYFLIRTGTWHQEQVQSYLNLKEDLAYTHGMDDARQDDYSSNQAEIDDAFNRGYDAGQNEGFKDGYNEGHRESSYNGDLEGRGRW